MKSFPRFAPTGLARRYFFAIGGGVGLVLMLAIGIETPLSYRATLGYVGEVQMADLRSAADRVNEYVQNIEGILRESAYVPWLQEPFKPEDLRVELHRVLKIAPTLDDITVVNSAGEARASVSRLDADNLPQPPIDPGLLQRAAAQGLAVGPVQFKDGLEPAVLVVIRAAKGREGFIAARLNLRNVSDIVSGLRVGRAGQAFLLDDSGRVVAHRDPAKTLQPMSEQGRRQLTHLRALMQGDPPLALPTEGLDADGVPVLASAIALPRFGWIIIAQEPLEEALAPVRATVLRLASLMALGVLIATLLGAAMARRLSRPILSLQEGTRRIAKGDLKSRVHARTGDEIEELAGDFNQMAAQLEEYTHGLERKVAEQTTELRTALDTAHSAMRARAIFLAAASHDLRQPLYAISILADALVAMPQSQHTASVLEKQREAIGVLRGLFDNLLDLSRLEAGEIRPALRVVNLQEVLSPLASDFEMRARAQGLEWRCSIAAVWVSTDPELLRRVVGNLLSNALRYTERGFVGLVASNTSGRMEVEVTDSGIGIAAEDQARIFDEFVQLDNVARDREKGVGLGLSIVRRISLLLDLRLRLSSSPGQGTRVAISVPVAEHDEEISPGSVFATDTTEVAGMRAWIVEDDRMVREALAIQFDAWGVDHDFATDRPQLVALRESDGEWPDAVMLDDMLGQGEQGLELAKWLGGQMPRERIALITGNVDPTRLEELRGGGIMLLRKPLSSAELLAWLRSAQAAKLRSGQAAAPAG